MSKGIIIDLCGGTGSWSKPYKDAGYDVFVITLPEYDVCKFSSDESRLYFDSCDGEHIFAPCIENIVGILAAPPCTMFSRARTVAKKPRDLAEGMKVVQACLKVIWRVNQDHKIFWAMENPTGYLRWFMGKPAFTFNPYEFGDRYRKPTDLWGNFNEPKKNPVQLTDEELERMGNNSRRLPNHPMCKPGDRACRRSITPSGFAQAFYKANKPS